MKLFSQLFNRNKKSNPIVVVSGLPRSGTSMMMKMLEAGGLEPITDQIRTPDTDNPKGYYEFERAKQLPKGDVAWLDGAKGKVVKILAVLLFHLPPVHDYKVVFMRRTMPEILASQRKMLINRGEDPDQVSDEEIAALYKKYLQTAENWMEKQANVNHIYVDYNQLMQDPQPCIAELAKFLENKLDVNNMTSVIEPNLYRQRV